MSLAYLLSLEAKDPHSDAIWGVHSSPSSQVISVSASGQVHAYDSTSGQLSISAPAHTLGIVSLSVSPDGKRALYNTIEGLTCLWDLEKNELAGRWESYQRKGHGEPAWSVSLNPIGATYAATGGGGNVSIHSADPSSFGEPQAKLSSGRNKFGMFCKHSPDGARLALSSETGQIYIFDLASSQLTATYTSHAMAVRSLAWSPDSQLLLSASEDKRLILHDVRGAGAKGGGAVASLTGHTSWVLSNDISPDGRLALSGSADRTAKLWDLSSRACVSTIQDPCAGEVWSVSWQRGPTTGGASGFVTGGEDGVVRWWRGAGAA
ncbi:WD40 repeat-like protein [Gloeophyllum trabeum ATCC 11539]|uniref:WD40 repeat-like protein n=1 Tax=Gloeophyllum trabeum (strain ATCC 11539 / FP-39264 / Madison 617) TaxID=670483 RepID=S7QG18_GLOTA|nr:WD40 repeat-like protein [Gloeophyllum trabeum ATCC 11539]EPQ58826.1 WD40 repeat-like protein [Gloeophyllum trabeum ATCC 11539]